MAARFHKGYLSFIIVFFGVLIATAAYQMAESTKKFDYSESIIIMKMHSTEMNVREVVKELALHGVTDADNEIEIRERIRQIPKPPKPPEPPLSIDEKKAIYHAHIQKELSKLDGYEFSKEFEVKIGCGAAQEAFASIGCVNTENIQISPSPKVLTEYGLKLKDIGTIHFQNPTITYSIESKEYNLKVTGQVQENLEILSEKGDR